ncbi:MAG: alpha/beta fold hydrolase [Candidatus Levyibacteriota bacterium]
MGRAPEKVGAGQLKTKLIVLHGWSTDIQKWHPFLKILEEAEIPFQFLKVPGLSAPLEKIWTLDDYVTWLHRETEKEKSIDVLGHSNGGKIALAFALRYPHKVNRLFLIDSAGVYHNELHMRVKRVVFKTIAHVGKKFTSSEKARKILYKIVREKDYLESSPMLRETMKNLIKVNLLPKLQNIKTPVIIIWGKEDKVTPFADALRMQVEMPHAKLFPIEGAKHSPQFTHTEKVAEVVKTHYEHF